MGCRAKCVLGLFVLRAMDHSAAFVEALRPKRENCGRGLLYLSDFLGEIDGDLDGVVRRLLEEDREQLERQQLVRNLRKQQRAVKNNHECVIVKRHKIPHSSNLRTPASGHNHNAHPRRQKEKQPMSCRAVSKSNDDGNTFDRRSDVAAADTVPKDHVWECGEPWGRR